MWEKTVTEGRIVSYTHPPYLLFVPLCLLFNFAWNGADKILEPRLNCKTKTSYARD